MSDEDNTDVLGNPGHEVPGESTPSDIEAEAIAHGWRPEGVEGRRSLSAEEFLDRQPLYDELGKLKKTTKKLQQGMEAMKQMHEGIRQREREKTIRELKDARKDALALEDYDAVNDIDDKIAEEKVAASTPPVNEAFNDWVEENEWYNQDEEMRSYADTIGAGYLHNNPNKPIAEVYKYVSKEVAKRFPDGEDNEQENDEPAPRHRRNPVEGAGKGRTASSGRYSERDLPEEARQIMNTIIRTGTMTKQEYLKQYFG